MVELRNPIEIEAALDKLMAKKLRQQVETVLLADAYGRYLAEDIIATHPVPHFDRSPLDGYAVRSEDTQGEGPTLLKVVELIGAGQLATRPLQSGEAVRIMTGAAIPAGADAVIMLELTREVLEDEETWVEFECSLQPNDNISLKGEDTAEGRSLSHVGERIGAGELAVLATFGYHQVKVFRRPLVGIISTGSELLKVEEPLEPGKIRNSNSYMIAGQIEALGGECVQFGMLPDEFELCCETVRNALRQVDYLITTGGVSVGDFDYIPEILRQLQAEVLFNKVAMRPGSVTTAACKREQWIFGLSGNPAACFVGFELFVRPILRTVLGSPCPHLPRAKAILQHDIQKPNTFTRFIRAKMDIQGSRLVVQAVGLDKSGVVSALPAANALIVVPGGSSVLSAGEEVEIIQLK